jgi:hypothetical protein
MGKGSAYHDLHACPIITTEGNDLGGDWRGHSSYSMNKHFASWRNMSDIAGGGKQEVFMGAAQPLDYYKALHRLDHTDIAESGSEEGLTYVYPQSKALGSFIDGSARLISIGEGAMMDPLARNGANFE